LLTSPASAPEGQFEYIHAFGEKRPEVAGLVALADGSYRAVFRALYETLLPDLRYPASADSYVTMPLSAHFAELMATRYNLPEYRALLRETLRGPVAETGSEYALFHRDPDFAVAPEDRVLFQSSFFPALRMAYLRTGADGRGGAEAAWELGGLHRLCLQRALDEVHPGRGVLFGRSGWTGQQAAGFTWAGDQASDFWSLRVLVVSALAAASSGISNFPHDVGGYLGHRLVERCPPEFLVRWPQFGCFTPLMHAHGRMPQEPWHYGERVLELYRAYALLHEQLVPYVRAAAATAARTGLPIMRPLCLTDPGDLRGWTASDCYGYGPALWVAPVLDDGAREREVILPRGDWIETWSGATVRGGGELIVPAPLEGIPVWVRAGSIVVTYSAQDAVSYTHSEPTRLLSSSYAVFCLKKKIQNDS